MFQVLLVSFQKQQQWSSIQLPVIEQQLLSDNGEIFLF